MGKVNKLFKSFLVLIMVFIFVSLSISVKVFAAETGKPKDIKVNDRAMNTDVVGKSDLKSQGLKKVDSSNGANDSTVKGNDKIKVEQTDKDKDKAKSLVKNSVIVSNKNVNNMAVSKTVASGSVSAQMSYGSNVYAGPNTGYYVSIGSVGTNEYVSVIGVESGFAYIEYSTSKGPKRGFIPIGSLKDQVNIQKRARILNYSGFFHGFSRSSTVYAGPGTGYVSIGSVDNNESVWVLSANDSGYAFIEYGTDKGLKRGYVPASYVAKASAVVIPPVTDTSIQIAASWKSGRGRTINAYKIGNGSKVLVGVFEIHGYEDAWAADGQELVKIANGLISNLSKTSKANGGLNGWTVYIVPSANPDGLADGFTNNGPGRTNIRDRIDINRCFPQGFSPLYSARNYTGNTSLIPSEAKGLYDFVSNVKKSSDPNAFVVLDVHGWENDTIGNSDIGGYFDREFGFSHKSGLDGQGYFTSWAQSIGAMATLVELPWPNSSQDIINRGYGQKVINAVNNILKSNIGVLPSRMIIDTPTDSQVTDGNLTVQGWALNQFGMKKVEIYIDGKLAGNATIGLARPDVANVFPNYKYSSTSGFKYVMVGSNFTEGTHTIMVKAIGNDNTSIQSSKSIIVKFPPKMNIEAPSEGQSVNNSFNVAGWALNTKGIKQVKIYIDGKYTNNAVLGLTRTDIKKAYPQYANSEKSGFQYNVNIAALTAGKHIVKVESIGNDNSTINQSRNFTLVKTPVKK